MGKFITKAMKIALKFVYGIVAVLVAFSWGSNPQPAFAAPISPSIAVTIRPEEFVPGQAGFIYITGGYPLETRILFDGSPLTAFWTGEGYIVPFGFGHDATPGTHTVLIRVYDPRTKESISVDKTINVVRFPYPTEEISIDTNLAELLDVGLNQWEEENLHTLINPKTTPQNFSWPFVLPTPEDSRITSQYGANRSYNNEALLTYHSGTDFRRHVGGPIYATADGRIAGVLSFDVRGNTVIIDHGYGIYSLYAHMIEAVVVPGQIVKQGDEIGFAGSTGRSEGPHVHFEILVNGLQVNPVRWLALNPGFVPPDEVPTEGQAVDELPEEQSSQDTTES